ncbi:hypothetical protein ACWD6P_22595 [Streptomyces sp. NPDC002446]
MRSRAAPAPVVTGVLGAVLAAAVGPHPELAVWLLLAPVAVALAMIDWKVHRLPDVLTLPMAGAAVLLLGVAAQLPGHRGSWTTAVGRSSGARGLLPAARVDQSGRDGDG